MAPGGRFKMGDDDMTTAEGSLAMYSTASEGSAAARSASDVAVVRRGGRAG